jgi:hypothetical protein
VVGFSPQCRIGTAGMRAATVSGEHRQPLCFTRQSAGTSVIQVLVAVVANMTNDLSQRTASFIASPIGRTVPVAVYATPEP